MCTLLSYKTSIEKAKVLASYKQINDMKGIESALEQLSGGKYIYRGVNDASYKMYSSAQRHWILRDKSYTQFKADNYINYVESVVNAARNSKSLRDYFGSKNIPVNDFMILSVVQHYANISPLVDFSFDPLVSLFFATDGIDPDKLPSSKLSDYISLYYIPADTTWMQSSLQMINKTGSLKADKMTKEYEREGEKCVDTKDVQDEIRNLTYHRYGNGDIPFIPVEGCENGEIYVNMPYIGFECSYNNENPRIVCQNGRFIFNPSADKPLIEVINETIHDRIVHCLDIHKSLVSDILREILTPKGVTKSTIYPHTKQSQELEKLIKQIYIP